MRHAETVTFGGSGLDRAAHLRGDQAAMAALSAATAHVLPLWRGKPLTQGTEAPTGLAWLGADHPALTGGGTLVFLGRDGDDSYFAQDISAWQPEALPGPIDSFFDSSVQHHPALPATQGFRELRALLAALTPREAELAAMARALLGWHATHGF
jgi:NAD+ diphosphatase